jgi:hypothetical protein
MPLDGDDLVAGFNDLLGLDPKLPALKPSPGR